MKKVCVSLFLLAWLSIVSIPAKAQEKPKMEWISGQISVSHDFKEAAYLNFMGPYLAFKVKKWTIAASFFPSLRFTEAAITPNLGFGGFIGYKKFLLVAPAYYINNVWIPAFGIGYKFIK